MGTKVHNVAVLIDGGFFLKRYFKLFPKTQHSPDKVAKSVWNMAVKHVGDDNLYRIFFYDCDPITKKVHLPVSKKSLDFSKSDQAVFRNQFFEELKKKRKVALRNGVLKASGNWLLSPRATKELLGGKREWKDLSDDDFQYDIRQKGIDMKIGVDIASLTLKKLVDKIVLVAGDADFVPASKLARREGVDIVLDPMWNPINPELFEHIDGLKTVCPKPVKPANGRKR
jgi:uncharacterized LabA/DUF88 family protein